MGIERLVSFLPSGTELLYELGEQDKIFHRSTSHHMTTLNSSDIL
ncbi:MAG: hypothetical protein OEL69_09870 [Nitrosopumilus sp.]|nr:hypothetical protein [Nitrosopumilus sp.]